jgi:hypothetical protein
VRAVRARLAPHLAAALPGLGACALMLVWAVHDGGYDADTWYWGALVLLAGLGGAVAWRAGAGLRLSRPVAIALAAFAGYVAWSYVSITWAGSPGDALEGSNRALLYLLLFAFLAVLPWTPQAALAALVTFVAGVSVIALVLLARLAGGDHVGALVIQGRLAAPTGYFNSTAALFTIGALTALVLATRRSFPAALRGALWAGACAGLQLAVVVQSRGWLFTLPVVALVVVCLTRRRVALLLGAGLVAGCLLANLHALLHVYGSADSTGFVSAAQRAGHGGLVGCALAFMLGTAGALLDARLPRPRVSSGLRRGMTAGAIVVALAVTAAGGLAATHGHPVRFISRQWHGFSHQQTVYASGSHFGDVGSGRYDFWRAAVHAFAAHPIGGLGQDNFADYYVTHRATAEEPSWTHSLEMRLLVHTGLVGTVLFAVFLLAAGAAALRARRREGLAGAVAAAALVPLAVWLVHGSIDWFWEIPALSGPALGFLAVASGLAEPVPRRAEAPAPRSRSRRSAARPALAGLGAVVFAAAALALTLPYLATRELSVASGLASRDPAAALHALSRAASLDPLSAEPGRVGGLIALQAGRYREAQSRFAQAIAREPGGWLSWLGAGLAASSLRQPAAARRDLAHALAINDAQPAVVQAAHDITGPHPLTAAQAIALLVPVA